MSEVHMEELPEHTSAQRTLPGASQGFQVSVSLVALWSFQKPCNKDAIMQHPRLK